MGPHPSGRPAPPLRPSALEKKAGGRWREAPQGEEGRKEEAQAGGPAY